MPSDEDQLACRHDRRARFKGCAAVTADGAQRFVLCEINVSSVSPFPPSSTAPLVEALRRRVAQLSHLKPGL